MPKLLTIPARPLGRVRLAFLGFGAITVVLGLLALLLVPMTARVPTLPGIASVLYLGFIWYRSYRTATVRWWREPLAAVAMTVYALSMPVPEYALGVFFVHLYITALYGTRWTMLAAIVFTVAAYVAAAALLLGSLVDAVSSPILLFQVPGLVLTGAIMRLLYEALTAQEELSRRVEEASRMEAVGRLTGGIAHDFNNMLTAIVGSIELALLDADEESDLHADLSLAQETAQRAGALTQQLLTFSKRKVLRPTRFGVNLALRDVEAMLSRMAGDSVRLEMKLADSESTIRIDPSTFEQVLMNLVVNGRDAMGREGGVIEIRTGRIRISDEPEVTAGPLNPDRFQPESYESLPPGEYAVIEVADDGPGMDPSTRSKVFEPFFTTKPHGTGLGLSTVYGVVTGADGRVLIESRPGEGTTVQVLIPTSPVPTDEGAEAGDATAEEAPSTGEPRPPQILIVDDEAGVRNVMERVLTKAGFDVTTASDGQEALDAFQAAPDRFDLVITDLSLPNISGAELGQRLREQRPDLRLLLTSGYSESSPERALNGMSGAPFLEKPFGSRELIDAAEELLRARPSRAS